MNAMLEGVTVTGRDGKAGRVRELLVAGKRSRQESSNGPCLES